MVDGLDGDDAWVMVEDEFLNTAKIFTQHLHHAEYQRLKKLARARSASTMSSIMRLTDGKTPMSMQTKKKIDGTAQRREIAKAIRNVGGDDSDSEADSLEEEDPWMSDPRLAGLMNTKEPSAKLGRLTGTQSSTQPSSKLQTVSSVRTQSGPPRESDEEDLDIAPSRVSMTSRTLQSVVRAREVSKHKAMAPVVSESDEADLDGGHRAKTLTSTTRKLAQARPTKALDKEHSAPYVSHRLTVAKSTVEKTP